MTYYQLAINEDGDPFEVGPEVKGWRPKRASDGRGRPALVHDRKTGKPLILPVDASHANLLSSAGTGRYRCEAVDAEGHRIDGIPVACTGPLTADGTPDDDELREEPAAKSHLEIVIAQMGQMAIANTRMAEKALEQMGVVMGGVAQLGAVVSSIAELVRATHSAGMTTRLPPLVPPSPVVIDVDDEDEDEDDEDEDEDVELDEDADNAPIAPVETSVIPEVIQFIIKETIAKVVPMIFSGGGIAGLPLEALLDWRKAAPKATPIDVQVTPSASVAPQSVPVASAPPSVTVTSSPMGAPMASPISATPVATPAATATTYGGAAAGGEPPGAVPATMATAPAPAGSSPEGEDDAAALLDAHITRIWQGLSPSERTRAGDLIARLNPEGRAALLSELVRLSVPEAIARARALLDVTPPI